MSRVRVRVSLNVRIDHGENNAGAEPQRTLPLFCNFIRRNAWVSCVDANVKAIAMC